MAADSDPNTAGLPPFLPEATQSHDTWHYHFTYLFICILVFRVARACGIVNRLHRLVILLCSLLTAAGRQRWSERKQLANELRAMRTELKSISITNEFARYSRLERRIKSSTRRFSQLAPESWNTSFLRVVVINVGLFLIEGLIIGWIVRHSPPITVSKTTLDTVHNSPFFPILYLLHYIPSKLLIFFWMTLCYFAANPAVTWLSGRFSPAKHTGDPTEDETGDSLNRMPPSERL